MSASFMPMAGSMRRHACCIALLSHVVMASCPVLSMLRCKTERRDEIQSGGDSGAKDADSSLPTSTLNQHKPRHLGAMSMAGWSEIGRKGEHSVETIFR